LAKKIELQTNSTNTQNVAQEIRIFYSNSNIKKQNAILKELLKLTQQPDRYRTKSNKYTFLQTGSDESMDMLGSILLEEIWTECEKLFTKNNKNIGIGTKVNEYISHNMQDFNATASKTPYENSVEEKMREIACNIFHDNRTTQLLSWQQTLHAQILSPSENGNIQQMIENYLYQEMYYMWFNGFEFFRPTKKEDAERLFDDLDFAMDKCLGESDFWTLAKKEVKKDPRKEAQKLANEEARILKKAKKEAEKRAKQEAARAAKAVEKAKKEAEKRAKQEAARAAKALKKAKKEAEKRAKENIGEL